MSQHPYRILQLHPHAPQDLIAEAYWKLIEVARARPSSSLAETYARILELNDAYGLLIDADRRRAYDDVHGLRPRNVPPLEVKRSRDGRRIVPPTLPRGDYYRLLCVDREASVEVVDTAYGILRRATAGVRPRDVVMHMLLREAHQTLRDPVLRFAYDSEIPPTTESDRDARDAASGAVSPAVEEPVGSGTRAQLHESSSGTGSADAALPAADAETWLSVDDDHSAPGDAWWERSEDRAIQPDAAEPSPVTEHALEGGVSHAEATSLTRSLQNRLDRLVASIRSLADTRSEHREALSPEDLERERLVLEEEQARLLALKEAVAAEGSAAKHDAPHAPAIVFTGGPRTGDRVRLSARALLIGSRPDMDVVLTPDPEVAEVHASIWQHGHEFVFRQLHEGSTVIDGERLTMPLVLLEDGDEIQMGSHVLRFDGVVAGLSGEAHVQIGAVDLTPRL